MMNRPELEEYKAFVKEGLIVPKLVQYTTDLGKYCDELEATLKCTQESWWGTMDNLDKHMKALDKLAEFAVSKQRQCYELMGFDEIEVDNSSFTKEEIINVAKKIKEKHEMEKNELIEYLRINTFEEVF